MTKQRWANTKPKLIAILRGIKNDEVEVVVENLLQVGFRAIEIPLNSPDPIKSIELAVRVTEASGMSGCLIGAGTVLKTDQVAQVHGVGGELIVSPNVNPVVIQKTVEMGMVSLPGVLTPTEAHQALEAGASGLKFFPASLLGASGIKAIKAILPSDVSICAVGGVGPSDFEVFHSVGVEGFGIGSDLYRPGAAIADVRARAQLAFESFQSLS